jgi:hypothetical protein
VDDTLYEGTIASDFDTEAKQVLAYAGETLYRASFKQPRPTRTTKYIDLTTARK